jgi:hypothetical protein
MGCQQVVPQADRVLVRLGELPDVSRIGRFVSIVSHKLFLVMPHSLHTITSLVLACVDQCS